MNTTSPAAEPRFAFNHLFRNAAVLAALVSASAAAPAAAASSVGPIEILACTNVYAPVADDIYAMGMLETVGVQIAYVNRGSVAAQDVTFTVGNGSDAATIEDRGSFAPGTTIRHTFATSSQADAGSCQVAAARFAGGTAYVAPSTQSRANR